MENSWEKRIEKHLLNQKIVKIKYMSEKESDRQGWSSRPIEITLSNGVLLVPMQDDEGNDGGSIATSVAELSTLPNGKMSLRSKAKLVPRTACAPVKKDDRWWRCYGTGGRGF